MCIRDRDQFERAEQAKLKKETARLAQAARRTADWSDRTEKGKFDTRNSGIRPDRGYVGHKAVSYTHLDVYKRQTMRLRSTSGLTRSRAPTTAPTCSRSATAT